MEQGRERGAFGKDRESSRPSDIGFLYGLWSEWAPVFFFAVGRWR